MKILIPLLAFYVVSIQAFCADSTKIRKEMVYHCLEMEKEGGFEVTEEEYNLLDSILAMAEKRIDPKDTLASNYPRNILKTIHEIIEEVGIEGDYNQEDPYKNLLSYSLRTKKFDCDKYSFIFLAIGERLNLPLHAVLLPSHMAVEWADDQHTFYWETTNESERTRDTYISLFSLNKYHFSQKMYLSRISREDLNLCFLYNRGITFFMLDKYKEAETDLDSSRALRGIHPFLYEMKHVCKNKVAIDNATKLLFKDPINDTLRIERAKAYIQLKGSANFEKALTDLNFILSINPKHKEAHLWRGVVYMNYFTLGKISRKNKNYKSAIEDFNLVSEADKIIHEAYYYKSILNRWARNYEDALIDINKALDIHTTDSAYVEKGNLFYNQKNYEKAIECYNKALEINSACLNALQCRGFAKLELEKRDDAAEDFFQAYYHGIMPYEYFKKYTLIRPEY